MKDLTRQRTQAESDIREASKTAIALVRRRETEQVEELAKRFETLNGAVAKRLLNVDRQITAMEQVLETAAAKVATASDVDVVKSLAGVLGEEEEDALDVDTTKLQNFLTRHVLLVERRKFSAIDRQ
nr:hypothetical protein BaRGS_013406 [Batillaria attramentaria]